MLEGMNTAKVSLSSSDWQLSKSMVGVVMEDNPGKGAIAEIYSRGEDKSCSFFTENGQKVKYFARV
uniref:Uncharacterized protein n=1 Tax=Romanomermis culicivorax TaxID=13658 RepID=A0A915LA43_ROMCU